MDSRYKNATKCQFPKSKRETFVGRKQEWDASPLSYNIREVEGNKILLAKHVSFQKAKRYIDVVKFSSKNTILFKKGIL